MSEATITVRTDDGRVIHQERLALAVEQEESVAPLLAAVSKRLGRPPQHSPIVAVQSAVGRTFD